MKKWLVLILAILMVVSLAACNKKVEQNDNPDDTPTNTTPTPVENPFTTVDEVVYTVGKDAKLYKDSDLTTVSKTLEKAATELHRIQVSEKYRASVVEYKGEFFYIQSDMLTTEDLYGKAYKAADKTMYAKEKVQLCSCASITLGEVVAILAKNDEVKVVAEGKDAAGNSWSKVEYVKGNLSNVFVKTSQLSAEQEVDYTKVDFSAYFTNTNVKRTVLVNALNLRIAPVVATATLAGGRSLKKDDVVTIIGYGKGIYASWGKVLYADPVEEGKTPEYKTYYVKLCSEQCNEAYIEVPELALQNQIAKLGFRKEEATLYVICDQLNIRYTPSLSDLQPDRTTNYYPNVATKGQALKMIAYGDVLDTDGEPITWAMIELDGVYLYVSKGKDYVSTSMTTVSGALTLEQLRVRYPALDLVAKAKITAKGKVTCYYDLDNTESGVELKADDEVVLVASGTKNYVLWYVFEKDGAYYCASKQWFKDEIVPIETSEPESEGEEETGETT